MGEIGQLLCDLGICRREAIAPYFPRVRDRDDVAVLRCAQSGVIFLSRCIDTAYDQFSGLDYWKGDASISDDDRRRAQQFWPEIRRKVWADVGCGLGGAIELLRSNAEIAYAVEPQPAPRRALAERGIRTFASVEEMPAGVEVVTLFHVFEHLRDPLRTLQVTRSKLKPGGKVIIEVPHGRDFLIAESDAFKAFTFWSEHLILHTRESLTTFLRVAGFHDIAVRGFQRYPLANHLHWLAKGKPGGHVAWKHLSNPKLDAEYAAMLQHIDATDTLIATASIG